VLIIKGEVPEHQLAAIYKPMIGFIVQGRKTISIGGDVVDLKAPAYFVIPTELPATGRVHQGSNGLPCLSMGLRLNQNALIDLLKDLSHDLCSEKDSICHGCHDISSPIQANHRPESNPIPKTIEATAGKKAFGFQRSLRIGRGLCGWL